jgi:hypothetical protein
MRRDRLKQRILHSFTHRKCSQTAPYTSDLRYSNVLGSSDRLLFAHPHPTTRAHSPASSADDSPMAAKELTQSCKKSIQCMHCTRYLRSYEFPRHAPTRRCQHDNRTCVYCLHNSVYAAFLKRGWTEARCLICGEQMSEEEASRLVLLWEEENMKS